MRSSPPTASTILREKQRRTPSSAVSAPRASPMPRSTAATWRSGLLRAPRRPSMRWLANAAGGLAGRLLGLGRRLAAIDGPLVVVLIYAGASLGSSIKLKELPLIDVFLLAGLYTIRLFGGGEASGHWLSLWLLGFSSFLFLSLALVKRVEELIALGASGGWRGAPPEQVLAAPAAPPPPPLRT